VSTQETGQAITAAAEAIFAVTQHEMDHEHAVVTANRHARLAVEAAAPLLHDNRWQALKDWLEAENAHDEEFRGQYHESAGLWQKADAAISARRSALAKMRELESQ
jgi:hypothetical protein